jgi:agmatinase
MDDTKIFLGESGTDYEKSKAAILPVPFEGTVTYMKGTAKAPSAIIESSKQLELYDDELEKNISEVGISTLADIEVSDAEETIRNVQASVKKILDGSKLPIVIGGEHSISSGAVAAAKDKFPNLSVLHLDAHADLRESYEGDKSSHACVMKRIVDLDVPTVHIGIRSLSDECAELIENKKLPVFYAKDIYDNNDWVDDAISQLSDDVYLTLDVDVFNVSVIPNTGTPEPGGLGWYQVIDFLKAVAEKKNIVGFDVVELIPDDRKVGDFTAAKLIYKLIGYILYK